MSILQLIPAVQDYIWGGTKLKSEFNIHTDKEIAAEAWILSCHPDGPCKIGNGSFAGKTLREYIETSGKAVLGTNCERFDDFPILTKFIDAHRELSIQVHPDNAYALAHENQYGKTEMWVVLEAEEGSVLYYGFKHPISKEEFARRIDENTLLEVLNGVEVHKGDTFFIESGTIHALGKGIVIAEIQQNSNVTYRVYDYGRLGKDGKPRELHIAKALDVTTRDYPKHFHHYPHLAVCDSFQVDHVVLDGKQMQKLEGNVDETSFLSVVVIDGQGEIMNGEDTISFVKGSSFFLPAGSGSYSVKGNCDLLLTSIPSVRKS